MFHVTPAITYSKKHAARQTWQLIYENFTQLVSKIVFANVIVKS